MKSSVFAAATAAVLITLGSARAGELDVHGEYVKAKDAIAFVDFTAEPSRFVPDDAAPECLPLGYTLATSRDALSGEGVAKVHVAQNCAERFSLALPAEQGSYRVTAWVRHGRAFLTFVVLYADGSGLARTSAQLGPTGRTTSDGWVEMASNELPVDGAQVKAAYLRTIDYGSTDGTEIDAIEVVRAGVFEPQKACAGALDPVCGTEGLCVHGSCALGRAAVPPLPVDALRNGMVDLFAARVRTFFGGARSRKENLPAALATIESARSAKTAWQFWGGLARSIRQLHDWHTAMGLPLGGDPKYSLNACFIEGDADASHALWPSHPLYPDVLVSHAGSGAAGLHAGDRLVAVDGQHPLAWARSLGEVDPGFHVATDPAVFADFAEALGGPYWLGGGLMVKYAKTLTVIRCDAANGTCDDHVETIEVASLTEDGGQSVACDNRPFYHLEAGKNPPDSHRVFNDFFDGKIKDTSDEEAIYGVVWDTLYGGGDPNGYVNGKLKQLIASWKASARGVILDHRAGNGGTLDSPELLTTLVRPPLVLAAVLMPIETAAFDGPSSQDEGLSLFSSFKGKSPYRVGSQAHDPELPVALVIHRDGSASDYLPLGMKGAPRVRIFGPHGTAGAFSTFVQLSYYGAFELQFASGDTITADGRGQIGHGVEPDEVVQQRQSDLLAGKDSIHEAALSWVRANLKPAAP
jgi:hypothetical protein